MKKIWINAVAAFLLASGTASAEGFPEREMLGVVMWGAGGATGGCEDVVSVAVRVPVLTRKALWIVVVAVALCRDVARRRY